MALRFITNTVWRDCALFTSNGIVVNDGNVNHLVGGPRYLGLDFSHDSNADHLIYQKNDEYDLAADTFIAAGTGETLSSSTDGYRIDYLDESAGWTQISPLETLTENVLTYSEQFDNAAWTKTRSSISANSTTDPNGTTLADALIEDGTAAASHIIGESKSILSGQAYVLSCYAKYDANDRHISFRFDTGFPGSSFAHFDIENGVVIGVSGGASNATIEDVGSGWYRCSAQATSTGVSGLFNIGLASPAGTYFYNGDGASKAFIWGAQVRREDGKTSSDYIKTEGASKFRDNWNSVNDDILVGPDGDDIILTFTEITDASAYRFKWGSSSPSETDAEIQKLWFGNSFEFGSTHLIGGPSHGIVSRQFLPKGAVYRHGRIHYQITEQIELQIQGASQSDVQQFLAQHRLDREPCFVYDSTGEMFSEKLLHVIVGPVITQPQFDDLYTLSLPLLVLKTRAGGYF